MGVQTQAARLRHIRTHARNALLKVKMFLSKWDDLVRVGRAQLEAACNTITSATTWPLICEHALKGCRGLQPAGIRTIRRRFVSAKHGLKACVADLETAIQEAQAAVHTQLDLDVDGPLFSCVNSQQFYGMLRSITAKYEGQLKVHNSIFQALPAADDLLNPESHTSRSWSLDQSHVIIATWMLQANVDRQEVDSTMQLLDSDVKTL
eukprot:jgi/Ulvmu1/9782/UM056_0022.1